MLGVDRLGAVQVALDVVRHGRDGRGAADGADDAALADAGGDDAGEIASLLLLEDEALVVRQELGRVALAREGGIRVALRVDADALVDTDELDVRVRLGGLGGVAADGEADVTMTSYFWLTKV